MPAILLRDAKAAPTSGRRRKIAGLPPLLVRAACRPIALSEGRGRGPLRRLAGGYPVTGCDEYASAAAHLRPT